ncbi:MAG: VWA domain-containing protein [Rhodospirillaceae bacterium]|nr:VWA domain-containing protein [Rhodospirillaceae bacterium]
MLPATLDPRPSLLERAMARYKHEMAERRQGIRIGFIVDATASRSKTWEQAQTIQARMFRATAAGSVMALRLVHFGGGHVTDHGWSKDARAIAANMAKTGCVSGLTCHLRALTLFADDPPADMPTALIVTGDCFEEDLAGIERVGKALAAKKVRVFTFLEGNDWTAETAFKRLAELTGGRFARFGKELPLGDLCEGVALITRGRKRDLMMISNRQVKLLLLTGPKEPAREPPRRQRDTSNEKSSAASQRRPLRVR